jgi:hypothetical protein
MFSVDISNTCFVTLFSIAVTTTMSTVSSYRAVNALSLGYKNQAASTSGLRYDACNISRNIHLMTGSLQAYSQNCEKLVLGSS